MTDFLEICVDKFRFRVANDRFYTPEGLWIFPEGNLLRIGVSDYAQQRSGDIVFIKIQPAGKKMARNEELATIETIKVNLDLLSPVSGTLLNINVELDMAPEKVNQDPYGAGWFCEIEPSHWDSEKSALLDAPAYYSLVKKEAEEAGENG